MNDAVVLYDYWRSSAAYRVRIALHLKGVAYHTVPVDLGLGQQSDAGYLAHNPQGLIPALAIDGVLLTQSLAIIDYLDQTRPDPPLLSPDPQQRAAALAQALIVASDIHPIQNLRVMNRLRSQFGADDAAVFAWNQHWIGTGFAALELQAPDAGLFGGDQPNLADICLVPQMANARRYEASLDPYPRLVRIDAALREHPAFIAASPELAKK